MDSLIAALIGMAGRSGDLAYNELNYWRSRKQEERLWNREDTAVQRRVADLEAAGLNPLLAVGSPASSGISSAHYGSSDFGGLSGELQDFLKNNYEAIKEKQEIDIENSRADLANKEASKDLLEAQKAEADARVFKAIAETENVNQKTRESAYNLGLYEALNLPTNSSGFMKDFGLAQSYGHLWFDNLMSLFSGGKEKTDDSKDKKSFDRLPQNSYKKEDILKSFEKAKEKNKRFAH